jgi:hypothetical protein
MQLTEVFGKYYGILNIIRFRALPRRGKKSETREKFKFLGCLARTFPASQALRASQQVSAALLTG